MHTNKFMSDEPLISIIVAIYQVGDFLDRCIESLISQTYENLQIILVDDGSTDNSHIVCEKYAEIDSRIEIYYKNNGGLVSARKFGLSLAKGEYVAFVDGDDYVDRNMYRELYKAIYNTHFDFVNSGYKIRHIGMKNEIVHANSFNWSVTKDGNNVDLIDACFFGKVKEKYVCPSIWSKLFRSDFIKNSYVLVPDKQNYGEDIISLFCCLAKCTSFLSIEKSFYYYCVREGSLSNIRNEKKFRSELKLYDSIFDVNEKMDKPYDDSRLYMRIREKVKDLLLSTTYMENTEGIVQYYIEDIIALEDRKTLIYGAGVVGKSYFLQLSTNERCSVIGMIDKYVREIKGFNVNIFTMSEIGELMYDVILIAIRDKQEANKIKDELIGKGVEPYKILWYEPQI